MSTRVLLLGAGFTTGNMGVGALAAGALTIVAQRYPGADVALLDYGREPVVSTLRVDGETVTVKLVNLRYSWRFWLANNIAALLLLALLARSSGAVRRALLRTNPWLARIAAADVALAVSGGDSFSDLYGIGRFLYVTLPQWLVVLLGVPLVMLPQTIGPFSGGFARRAAAALVRRSALVCVRDQAGLGTARGLLDGANAPPPTRFCHDIAFVVEPHPPPASNVVALPARPPGARPLVGVNVSGLLLAGNPFGLKVDYATLVERIVERLIAERGVDVLLVPHVFSGDAECDLAAAATLHERLQARCGAQLFRIRERHDQHQIKHVIGGCEFFIGSRMHACIGALSQCIPAVGLAYSDKFAGVFESVGAGALVIDPRRTTIDEACAQVLRAYDERAHSRARLRAAMPGIRSGVLTLLDDVPCPA